MPFHTVDLPPWPSVSGLMSDSKWKISASDAQRTAWPSMRLRHSRAVYWTTVSVAGVDGAAACTGTGLVDCELQPAIRITTRNKSALHDTRRVFMTASGAPSRLDSRAVGNGLPVTQRTAGTGSFPLR